MSRQVLKLCLLGLTSSLDTSITRQIKRLSRTQTRWTQSLTNEKSAIKRPPVVTIMGHVDHGKTTLLDYLRNSKIVEQEFGGITQHIGAFVVPFKLYNKTELVTFLDTPGHAAFSEMRQRGANLTDIVILVVACDDGVLDQTVESIKYAQQSDVPIIVAINKIDKFRNESELDKSVLTIRRQLIVHNVIPEEDGGEVQLVKISALRGKGIDDLKECILALAETLELRAEMDCLPSGRIIESQVDKHRGKLCTILVQKGQLQKGDVIIAGAKNWAKVRALFDERQKLQQACQPGLPIQVIGWREDELPSAGDPIVGVENEAEAKRIIVNLKQRKIMDKAVEDQKESLKRQEDFYKIYREKLEEKRASGIRYGRVFLSQRGHRLKEAMNSQDEGPKINLVLKCDVDGSLETILNLLDTYDKDNRQHVKLDLMHYGVGPVSESDLTLATSFPDSIIYGFNVTTVNQKILLDAKRAGTPLRFFNVIYHLYDDLKARLNAKMPELEREVELGRALVLAEFIMRERKKKIHIAGCRCTKGLLTKDALYRHIRSGEELGSGYIVKSLRHDKDDVKEIEKERECGIILMRPEESPESTDGTTSSQTIRHELQFKPGDTLVAYEKQKYLPILNWGVKGFA